MGAKKMLYQILTRSKRGYIINRHFVEMHCFDTDDDAVQWCKDYSVNREILCLRVETGKPAVAVYVKWLDYTDQYKQDEEERLRRSLEVEAMHEEWKRMPWYKKIFNLGKVI